MHFWYSFTHFSNIFYENMSYQVFFFLYQCLKFVFYQEIICFFLDVKYFHTKLYVVFFCYYFKFFSNSGFTFSSFLILLTSV